MTHAYCALADLQVGAELISQSFSMLITGEISGGAISESHLQMALTYLSVLLFTVFFLNVFIGVIGENYSIQKTLSPLVFQKVRAGICSTYLLRASVIPGWMCPTAAGCLSAAAGAVMLLLQAYQLAAQRPLGCPALVFAACQATMFVCCYQNADLPWAKGKTSGERAPPHYIWYAEAVSSEAPSQLSRVEHCLGELRDLLMQQPSLSAVFSPTSPGTAVAHRRQGTATPKFFS
uniref:Uncharacterized protein n=1 Tax=Zooxanthella nutricula TaxID=1333877 RepID=A0A7S2QH44_9DINO